jgi:DNA-binding protein
MVMNELFNFLGHIIIKIDNYWGKQGVFIRLFAFVIPPKLPRGENMAEDNTVFIGKKATMNYVLAVVTQFNSGLNEVIIKARGRAISRAVDVAEIVRHRFVMDAVIKEIKIDTEVLQRGEEGTTANVSSIEIYLSKK